MRPVPDIDLNDAWGSKSSNSDTGSTSSRNSAKDAREMEQKAQVAIEISRAQQLADSGAAYGSNEELAGSVVPMDRFQYDCISELSAVTGKPLISTGELANPNKREQYFSDVPEGQQQPGDWRLVRYKFDSSSKVEGHVQMDLGNNRFADSTPFSGGPRVTSDNPVDRYLANNNAEILVNILIRPRR